MPKRLDIRPGSKKNFDKKKRSGNMQDGPDKSKDPGGLVPKSNQLSAPSFVEAMVDSIFPSIVPNLRRKYAIALRHSLQKDPGTSNNVRKPDPYSVERIMEETGLTSEQLVTWRIVTSRSEVAPFLLERGFVVKKNFRNRYNSNRFKMCFGREPFRAGPGRKPMMLTYAEWLHLLDLNDEPQIPTAILELCK